MGVCAHVAQGVDDEATVEAGLSYTGIRNMRDDGTTSAATIQAYLDIHAATGAQMCLLPVDGDVASSLSLYRQIKAAGALLAIEGPNEINNFNVTYNGQTSSYSTTFLPAALFTRDLYAAVKADATLKTVPVFAPSEAGGTEPDNLGLQFLTIPAGFNASLSGGPNTQLPDGTIFGDFANVHNYLNNGQFTAPIDNHAWGAEDPTGNTYWDSTYGEYTLTWRKHYAGYSVSQLAVLPRVTTETGWTTQGTNSLTEDQQGKIFLNLFLDAYKRGWSHTFIYMLRDDPIQGYWGLLHTDDSAKLSGTYLHNLTTILADNTSQATGSLNYAVPNEPATVHDLLLQKSNGTFELAVWDERTSASDTVMVNLNATYSTVNVYDPTIGTSPIVTLTNANAVPLIVSDHPYIIELPSAPTAVIQPSASAITVPDGSSGTFTVSLLSAPTSPVTVNVSIGGTPNLTVSPSTLTMTPQNYQNQTVTVTAAAVNSNDADRSSTILLTSGMNSASVVANDVPSDSQTAANLEGTAYPLAGSNVGSGSAGDSSVRASGNWWVDGSGTGGLAGTADSFHFESQSVTGDFQMIVKLQDLAATGATTPLAGLMIRDGSAAGSNFLALAGTAATSGGYDLLSRTSVNTVPSSTVTAGAGLTYTYPAAWMELTRSGNILHAFVSSDGVHFQEVTDPVMGVSWTGLSSTLNIGLFSSSGGTANARALMSNFSIATPGGVTLPTPPTLADADIGGPGFAGSASVSSAVFTVKGGGADIWNNYDQFNFDSESATGDNTMIVHLDSQQNTNVWAKAGPMFRNSTAGGAANVCVLQNPVGLAELQWRDADNGYEGSVGQVGPSGTATWLALVKSGTTFTGYYATTTNTPAPTDWVLIGSHTTTLNTSYLAGLAVCSHDNSQLGTAVFSHVSIQSTAATTPFLSATASGAAGAAFSYQLDATNTSATYSATGLPTGLAINANTGLISGTPAAGSANSYPVTVTITDPGGTVTDSLVITILPPAPAISSATHASALINTPFSYQIAAANNPTTYTALGLPSGLSCDPNSGLISGTPTIAGTTIATLFASNSTGTGSSLLTIALTNPASVSVANTDTPTMPPWGLAVLGALLLAVASRFLPSPTVSR